MSDALNEAHLMEFDGLQKTSSIEASLQESVRFAGSQILSTDPRMKQDSASNKMKDFRKSENSSPDVMPQSFDDPESSAREEADLIIQKYVKDPKLPGPGMDSKPPLLKPTHQKTKSSDSPLWIERPMPPSDLHQISSNNFAKPPQPKI